MPYERPLRLPVAKRRTSQDLPASHKPSPSPSRSKYVPEDPLIGPSSQTCHPIIRNELQLGSARSLEYPKRRGRTVILARDFLKDSSDSCTQRSGRNRTTNGRDRVSPIFFS